MTRDDEEEIAARSYRARCPMTRWEARTDSAWFFLDIPEDVSDEISVLPVPPGGWGSIKVRATVGAQTWETSVFPDSKRGFYVLPVKKAVRQAEGIEEGDWVELELEIIA